MSGKREVVAEPQKRPVGRPKKVSAEELEEPLENLRSEVAALGLRAEGSNGEAADAVVETETPMIQKKWSREDFTEAGREGAEFGRLGGRPAKPEAGVSALVPLSSGRKRKRNDSFGLSAKAQLVKLHDKLTKSQPRMSPDAIFRQLARETNRPPKLLRKVIEAGGKWMKMLRSLGHTATGLRRDEAQKPQYLRT